MNQFPYIYDSNNQSDMEKLNFESKKMQQLEGELRLFLEMMDTQEKQGFPSRFYVLEKVKHLQRELEDFARSV